MDAHVTQKSRNVGFISVTVLIDSIGFGIVAPVMPRLLQEILGVGPTEVSSTYGFLVASYAAMLLLFSPVIGRLSDHFGRKPIILFTLSGMLLNNILTATAISVEMLYAALIINGICGANISTASAYISDITPAEKRAQSIGLVYASFALGLVIGPAIGGALGGWNLRAPFWATAALTSVNFCYGFFMLPESLSKFDRRAFKLREALPFISFIKLANSPAVRSLIMTYFLIQLAGQILQANWVLYTQFRFGWTQAKIGISLTFLGMFAIISSAGLTRILIPRLGERIAIWVGMIVGALTYAMYGMASAGWEAYIIMMLACVGGITTPALQSIISQRIPPGLQGEFQGAMGSIISINLFLAPILGNQLFAYFTSNSAPIALPGVPYFLSSLLMFLALFVYWCAREGQDTA